MSGAPRGRPPNPVDPDASHAARLGAELRTRRLARGLTLQALGDLIGYSPQHISGCELATSAATRPFVTAVDRALDAEGALLALLPAAIEERTRERDERVAARRTARDLAPLGCESHSDVAGEDADVDPTNRRGLIGEAGVAALGLSMAATPAAARDIDPELPAYWAELLAVFGRHDAAFGPHEVIGPVRHQLGLIAGHRQVARGELRVELMRIEARWAEFAAWLSNDAGQMRRRDAWTDRAAWLAQEADYADIHALAYMRRSQWAAQEHDTGRAVAHARAALRVQMSLQTRTICELRAAHAHALVSDEAACERHVAAAYALLDADSPAPAGWGPRPTTVLVHATEARCWLHLRPPKAVAMFESVLREWPRDCVRTRGLHQARLALACAAAGERDRAIAEGSKALAIAQSTKSSIAARELRLLRATLSAD